MLNDNKRNYVHIYMDLTDDIMYYHFVSAPYALGQVLLDFVYGDVERIKEEPERIRELHPYFSLWTEDMTQSLFAQADEKKGLTFEQLKHLQSIYKKLLDTWVGDVTDANEEASHYLLRHPFYSSGTLTNRTVENENHWMVDYFLMSFEDCLMCELMEIVRRHMNVKICKNCGRFFIPKRSNVDYCTRVFSEDGRTCSDVGYMKTFAKSVKKDELLQAYTRAYKAHYARMTKPRKRMANMTRDEFEAWYKEAKEGLEMARQGKISPEAYKEWLKK